MKAIGRHLILEMWGCSNLNSLESAEDALREMVVALDVHLLDLKVYPFSPVGVTGVAIVSESHLVIHTWPEHGYAAVDIFTCGAPRDPQAALGVLRRHFRPDRVQVMEINRGQLELSDAHETSRGQLDLPDAQPEVDSTVAVNSSKSLRAPGRSRAPALSA
jgi:S-adenosylmethionine decarboxylase